MTRKGEIDMHWEAMCYVVGFRHETRSERGRFNVALKEIKETGSAPEEIVRRAKAYVAKWPTMELTPTALAAHWGELAGDGPGVIAASVYPYKPHIPQLEAGDPNPEATERARQEFMAKLRELGEGTKIPDEE